MTKTLSKPIAALLLASALLGGQAFAQTAKPAADHKHDHAQGHDHKHDHKHGHDHGKTGSVHDGYFEDAQVQERTLGDWAGEWQSLYPHLEQGTLDPVMAHKAEHGDKTAAEYRAYYENGYKTDTDRITITGDHVSFATKDATVGADYKSGGYEILTYEKGNRGVRYVFEKVSGDAAAPQFIQFSDHIIAPEKSGHFHLYWGNDRKALLSEVSNWPTYYPAALSADQIVAEMLAH